ncbi:MULTISPECIES: DUF6194 family protein [unclassified Mycolicibacterium]|uniref:DUF6194 family protein n=1 Tax=unclassified Mycolicibacterium TaxID=2636767 RepID=UPI0012DC8062|nr:MULTISPECIES: DUF6194 family protein [unclassified Mycolicibacterium]MUL82614.1 hypothetical protein [Mycolicibacterium sp. CBMA 329]MUL88949.1 hypothetical protein [Mycolicibacterium sp. CBMA 331]MUL97516.1 hypothetical protein [Mycolicibacterium sp. CBMA 334]MUM26760.1 hypothetical protein [Mycolicibacterium sp. CBMA 295]MUM38465.1 hypothetical protein [Mycolicibacterium sp. CBMA 247]
MSLEQILEAVREFDGVLELAPTAGSEFPEIAWGDHFFYYAPDGKVPAREQPYATVVTKNYPDDTSCDLDTPGRRRLNIHVGRGHFIKLTGEDPRSEPAAWDYSATDIVVPHPLYRRQGWVSIINPGEGTHRQALVLLRAAHDDAKRRFLRRRGAQVLGVRGDR